MKYTVSDEGHNNSKLFELVQELKVTDGERIISSGNNSFIRIGRDRYGGPQEGKGSNPQGSCGAIDLFTGAGPKRLIKEEDMDKYLNPNFNTDGARIYISQRTDIDKYFGLANGVQLNNSNNRSGIALKADHVRVIGRQHIKIVTGKSYADGQGSAGELNSQGGQSDSGGRIEFITGNNTDQKTIAPLDEGVDSLQPLVLGENLKDLLEEMLKIINSLTGIVLNNTSDLQSLSAGLTQHFHTGVGLGAISTFPDPGIIAKSIKTVGKSLTQQTVAGELEKFNIKTTNMNYLTDGAPVYILSNGVYTT